MAAKRKEAERQESEAQQAPTTATALTLLAAASILPCEVCGNHTQSPCAVCGHVQKPHTQQ